MTRVAVSGANGFVGSHLSHALVSKFTIRMLTRTPIHQKHKMATVENVVIGDLATSTDFSKALSNVDVVVHTAAHVHQMNPSPEDEARFDKINYWGTRKLLEASYKHGVKHFIFLSTVKVNGERSFVHSLKESDEANPQDAYAKSKLKAEKYVVEFCQEKGMQYTILRLPLVYGVGVKANFERFYALCKSHRLLPFKSLQNRRSLLYIDNLISAVSAVLTYPSENNGIYFVTDDDDVSVSMLAYLIAKANGNKLWQLAFPLQLFKLIGMACGKKEVVARLSQPLCISCNKFKHDFDWVPLYTTQEALQKIAQY